DYIDMEGCYISDISFPGLTEVEILNLSYNELKSLDLSHMSKLQALYLGNNPFSESPLVIGSNKPDLTILSMNIIDNLDQSFNMSDYPALRSFEAWHVPTLTHIDPSRCPDLLQLSIDLTNVSSIDVSNNPNLLILNVADTRITELDLSNNPYLSELYCGHMAAGYEPYAMTSLNLGSKPNLQRLFCQGNALTTLDVSGCPKLTDLSCSYNYLTEISLDANPNLVNLNISMNLFTFATLPMPRDTFNEYYYYQRSMGVERSYAVGTTLDFSSEMLRDGSATKGFLYKVSEEDPNTPVLLDDEYYTYADGKITLDKTLADSVMVTFTNDLFPEYPLSTSKFMVKTESEMGKPSPVVELSFYPTVKNIELSVGMQGASAESPLQFMVDFGNGQLVDFTATSSSLPSTANVTGTRSGRVTIYMPENTAISAFGINGQRLMSADVSRAVTLEQLSITDCLLPAISLTWNRCLSSLDLSGNNLSTLDMSEPNGSYGKNMLQDFKAARNRLTDVTFSTRTCIHSIDLSDNQFAELNLLKFSELTHLNISGNQLTEVDLRDLEAIVSMDLSNNNLSDISLLDYLPLESLNISGNSFTFATLPAPGVVSEYVYAPQAPISLPEKAPSINLSDNYIEVNGAVTQYEWVMDATGAPVPDGAVAVNGNGLFRFADPDLGVVRCLMTHAAFPDFKDADVYTTTAVETAAMPTHVFATFTTLEDGVAELSLRATKPDAAVYIDWENNGYLEQYVLDTKPISFIVNTKAGADVKCYSYDENELLDVFSFGGAKLASIDASRMMNLIHFSCANSGLKVEDIILPPCKDILVELSLAGNEIEAIDLSEYTSLRMLNLSDNKLTAFDASPFKSVEVLYLANNSLTSVTLDNPIMWECVLIGNKLDKIDLSHIPMMQQLFISDNLLTDIDVSAMPLLKDLFIDNNYFTFATLPVLNINRYVYANQAVLKVTPEDGYIVDLSSQVSCQGTPTKYTWYIDSPYYDEEGNLVGEDLYEGEEYSITDGVTTFLKPFTHIMCVMTNPLLPNIVLYTEFIDVNPVQGGLEEIAAVSDSLSARWFNLSGVCVAETAPGERPSVGPGIYVRLTSEGASKVLVR
ncbi:MAG: hypothetical protein K2H98_04930, partial [Duncaniella sp.]|nr:hypothetical protein [Duncaniella sp.]